MEKATSPRTPHCSKCRNHGTISPLRGHKRRCIFMKCQCAKCALVDARRDISKRQIALRRLQLDEETFGINTNDVGEILPVLPYSGPTPTNVPPFVGSHCHQPQLNTSTYQQGPSYTHRNWCGPVPQGQYCFQPYANQFSYNNEAYPVQVQQRTPCSNGSTGTSADNSQHTNSSHEDDKMSLQ